MAQAYVALGSNLGNRDDHLNAGREGLMRLPNTVFLSYSSVREYPPVDCPHGSQDFLNAAAALNTQLSPLELFKHLQKIEQEAGRSQSTRNAPRVLDLDLLLYDDKVMATPDLDIPHPRMTTRRFVLEPLAEIAPRVVHPTQHKTIAELLEALK